MNRFLLKKCVPFVDSKWIGNLMVEGAKGKKKQQSLLHFKTHWFDQLLFGCIFLQTWLHFINLIIRQQLTFSMAMYPTQTIKWYWWHYNFMTKISCIYKNHGFQRYCFSLFCTYSHTPHTLLRETQNQCQRNTFRNDNTYWHIT